MKRFARDRKDYGESRVELVNKLTNNMGQALLTLTDGDWDLTLSVTVSLLASTVAQSAVAHGESAEELFDEIGTPTRATVLAFEKSLLTARLAEEMARLAEEAAEDEGDVED